MGLTSRLLITLGANCGSISTTSAPVARILARPARMAAPWSAGRAVAQHRIGAELPQHQVGLGGDHGLVEAPEHVADDLAADAAIEHLDRVRGKAPLQFGLEPAGVIRRARAGAGARGRGRADGDDDDRLAASPVCARGG